MQYAVILPLQIKAQLLKTGVQVMNILTTGIKGAHLNRHNSVEYIDMVSAVVDTTTHGRQECQTQEVKTAHEQKFPEN